MWVFVVECRGWDTSGSLEGAAVTACVRCVSIGWPLGLVDVVAVGKLGDQERWMGEHSELRSEMRGAR